MKNKALLLLPIILASLTLAGCASQSRKVVDLNLKYVTANSAPINAGDRNAQTQIAQASAAIGQSLQKLSAIELATHPRAHLAKPLNPRVTGMNQVVSLSWTGPVQPLLRRIAGMSGYRLHIYGRAPAIPALISINARNRVLTGILRSVQYQIRHKARISVQPRQRVINLRYFGN